MRDLYRHPLSLLKKLVVSKNCNKMGLFPRGVQIYSFEENVIGKRYEKDCPGIVEGPGFQAKLNTKMSNNPIELDIPIDC